MTYEPRAMVRFWNKVNMDGDCWEWTGQIGNDGYGKFKLLGKTWRSHRLAYGFIYGHYDSFLQVLHTCDNKKCVRPTHLYCGVAKDNARDRCERGQQPTGTRCGMSKLNEQQVRDIRAQYKPRDKEGSSLALAKKFGVSYRTILYIAKNETWRQV